MCECEEAVKCFVHFCSGSGIEGSNCCDPAQWSRWELIPSAVNPQVDNCHLRYCTPWQAELSVKWVTKRNVGEAKHFPNHRILPRILNHAQYVVKILRVKQFRCLRSFLHYHSIWYCTDNSKEIKCVQKHYVYLITIESIPCKQGAVADSSGLSIVQKAAQASYPNTLRTFHRRTPGNKNITFSILTYPDIHRQMKPRLLTCIFFFQHG